MIKTKKELKKCLILEKQLYHNSRREWILDGITHDQRRDNWRYLKLVRKCEYYYNTRRNFFSRIMYVITKRRKNLLGRIIGVEIYENSFDIGLLIHHNGSIVINGGSRIGKNCQLHGCNCIGNAGKGTGCPIIGDNCDIGVGAVIIGNIRLGNNIKVGAGAVVVKDCLEDNCTLVGVPARIVRKEEK